MVWESVVCVFSARGSRRETLDLIEISCFPFSSALCRPSLSHQTDLLKCVIYFSFFFSHTIGEAEKRIWRKQKKRWVFKRRRNRKKIRLAFEIWRRGYHSGIKKKKDKSLKNIHTDGIIKHDSRRLETTFSIYDF